MLKFELDPGLGVIRSWLGLMMVRLRIWIRFRMVVRVRGVKFQVDVRFG